MSEVGKAFCWRTKPLTLSKVGFGRGTVLKSLRQDWEEETSSFARTSLCASHQIAASHNDGDRVFLYWCRHSVSGELNVAKQMVVKRWVCESKDWFWDIVTRCFHWDIVVVGEVDTSMALVRIVRNAEELALGLEI